MGVALLAVSAAACFAHWIPVAVADGRRRGERLSAMQIMALRTVFPVLYMVVIGIAELLAGPASAGLASTFPSMSLVVLVVTHLEAGPCEASRIAQVLPASNLSTLAFLAAFRCLCPEFGVGGGMIAGYASALIALCFVEGILRRPEPVDRRSRAPNFPTKAKGIAWRTLTSPGHRGAFARCAPIFCAPVDPAPAVPASISPRLLLATGREFGVVNSVNETHALAEAPLPFLPRSATRPARRVRCELMARRFRPDVDHDNAKNDQGHSEHGGAVRDFAIDNSRDNCHEHDSEA